MEISEFVVDTTENQLTPKDFISAIHEGNLYKFWYILKLCEDFPYQFQQELNEILFDEYSPAMIHVVNSNHSSKVKRKMIKLIQDYVKDYCQQYTRGGDVNDIDEYGKSVLEHALNAGDLKVVMLLVALGARISSNHYNPHLDTIDNVIRYTLFNVISNGPEMVNALINSGMKVKARYPKIDEIDNVDKFALFYKIVFRQDVIRTRNTPIITSSNTKLIHGIHQVLKQHRLRPFKLLLKQMVALKQAMDAIIPASYDSYPFVYNVFTFLVSEKSS